jgi:hypothetical protein
VVGEKIRWFEQCAHGIELHEYCPICADLTTEARQMFEPVEDKKEGTYAPDPR